METPQLTPGVEATYSHLNHSRARSTSCVSAISADGFLYAVHATDAQHPTTSSRPDSVCSQQHSPYIGPLSPHSASFVPSPSSQRCYSPFPSLRANDYLDPDWDEESLHPDAPLLTVESTEQFPQFPDFGTVRGTEAADMSTLALHQIEHDFTYKLGN